MSDFSLLEETREELPWILSACFVFNFTFSSYPEQKLHSLHSQAFSYILLGAFPITLSRGAALGTGNQRLSPRHPELAPLLLCLLCAYQALTQMCIFSPKLPHWVVRRKWFGLVLPLLCCTAATGSIWARIQLSSSLDSQISA